MHPECARLVEMLERCRNHRDPNPGRDRIDGLEHCLQTASRAIRQNAPMSYVIGALLHDAARELNDQNHGDVIAAIMQDRLPSEITDGFRIHSIFQSDILHGTRFSQCCTGRLGYEFARKLSGWDAASYDPDYTSFPLSGFIPMLEGIYNP